MKNVYSSIAFITIGLTLGSAFCFFAPKSFKDSYQSMLLCQYDHYRSITTPGKILVIGGSSVAFGIDLDVMEAKTGCSCTEFGVHLGTGYSFLMEASKCNLHSGDIVVIEFFNHSIDDFDPELILSGIGDRLDMYRFFLPVYITKVAADYPRYIAKRYFYNLFTYQDNGYDDLNFDARGCMTIQRDEKNAPNIDEFTKGNEPFSYPDDLAEDFIEYLSDYVDYCQSLGVKVFFTYPPYMKENWDWNGIDFKRYDEEFASKLPAPLITSLEDAIYSKEYIWGFPFHLNTEGAKIRSERLAEALKPYLESE